MFNWIVYIFSSIKDAIFFDEAALVRMREECAKECVHSMNETLSVMMRIYHDERRLPSVLSDEFEGSIQKSLKDAKHLKDEEFDSVLRKIVEIFPKIKYID